MTIITEIATVEVNIDKRSARNIAATALLRNKRATNVLVCGYNVNVMYAYTGQRSDEEGIRENLKLLRVTRK